MRSIPVILSVLSLFCCSALRAQVVIPDRIEADTSVGRKQVDRSGDFYDKLKEKSANSGFARMLYRAFVTSDDRAMEEPAADTKMVKEIDYFTKYAGETIDNIYIFRNNVFPDTYSRNNIRSWANSIHMVTRENKIYRNLLFKEGETVNPEIMAKNEQLLRDLNYLSDAYIVVAPNEDTGGVDVFVFTRDTWTITVDWKSRPQSNYYIHLYDNNFLGTGNRFGLRTYVSAKHKVYGGNMVEYKMSNILGSFFDLEAAAGKGYEEMQYGLTLSKPFILRNDYMAGGQYESKQFYEQQTMDDTILLIKHRNADVWGGKAWYSAPLRSSFFLTTGYQDLKYFKRPEVRPDTNNYYQSHRSLLIGTGLYRESFYRGNMIYGFGATEDVPYGHKLEIIAGRYWGEFNDKWYGSVSLAAGRQTRHGYLRGEVALSSFMASGGRLEQSALQVNLNAFSNLMKAGRSNIRQFGTLRYLHGFGRFEGEGERLTFYGENAPRGIKTEELLTGKVRLSLNTETVVFTPIYFYGFRFAFFGFADFGWLGDKNMVFNNDFFTTIGLGVRLKNERLIFNTIQLRFGFALNNKGFMDYNYFKFTSESRLRMPKFKPEGPDLFRFR